MSLSLHYILICSFQITQFVIHFSGHVIYLNAGIRRRGLLQTCARKRAGQRLSPYKSSDFTRLSCIIPAKRQERICSKYRSKSSLISRFRATSLAEDSSIHMQPAAGRTVAQSQASLYTRCRCNGSRGHSPDGLVIIILCALFICKMSA